MKTKEQYLEDSICRHANEQSWRETALEAMELYSQDLREELTKAILNYTRMVNNSKRKDAEIEQLKEQLRLCNTDQINAESENAHLLAVMERAREYVHAASIPVYDNKGKAEKAELLTEIDEALKPKE